MSARTGFGAALFLVGYIGSWSIVSAATATPKPETATAARTRADLTRNREALRKVMTAQAHRIPAKRPTVVRRGVPAATNATASHGAPAATNATASNGAPAGPNASEAHGPLAVGAIPGQATAAPKSGAIGTVPASLSHPRMVSASGGLGGPLASNTLTPVHRSPAAPVTLGGAPVRRNAGYSAIDGSVFHHKP